MRTVVADPRHDGGVSSDEYSDDETRKKRSFLASRGSLSGTGAEELFRRLIGEVRRPFGQLISECSDVAALSRSLDLEPSSRERLISYMGSCVETVASDLSEEELKLWSAFLTQDAELRGTILASTGKLRRVLQQISDSPKTVDAWVVSVKDRATDDGELDFADLLDWSTYERKPEAEWSFTSELGKTFSSTFTHLFIAGGEAEGTPGKTHANQVEMRNRCNQLSSERLAEAAVAYQRSMILTACWICERNLRNDLLPTLQGANSSTSQGVPPGMVSGLLTVLRAINAELAPPERVLWELSGSKDADFDGQLTRRELCEAMTELSVFEEVPKSPEEEELMQLRADCQQESLDALFLNNKKRRITLADILKWWWDMPEDFRIAAGFDVPAPLIHRGIRRQPEEMFKAQLKKVASHSDSARLALRGAVRVFAELKALATRRNTENLRSGGVADDLDDTDAAKVEEPPLSEDGEHESVTDEHTEMPQ